MSDTKPSTGAALVAHWDRADRSLAYQLDRDAMAADMDAAIKQARREGAEAMRGVCMGLCSNLRERFKAEAAADTGRGNARAATNGIHLALGALACRDAIMYAALTLPGDAP